MIRIKYIIPFLIFLLPLIAAAQQTFTEYDPDKEYKKGLLLFDQELYAAAKEKFAEVLKESTYHDATPTFSLLQMEAAYYFALSSLKLNTPDAAYLAESFIREYPGYLHTRLMYLHLGQFFYHKKNYSDAIANFEEVDPFDLLRKNVPEYKFQLGYSYFYKKKLKEAKPLFFEIKRIKNKYYYPANYYYGFISYHEKDYDEALSHFRNVETSSLYSNIIPYYVANIYFLKGNYEKVVSYVTPLIRQQNIRHYIELNHLIGQAYFQLQEYNKALPFLRIYVDETDELRQADLYQLAYAQYKIGNYRDAVNNFNDLAYGNDSLAQNALYNMANSFIEIGEKENARNAYQEAARLNYDKEIKLQSAFNAAKLSYELGYQSAAIKKLQTFINKYPESSYAEEAKNILTQLFLSTRNYKDALEIIKTIRKQTPEIKRAFQKIAYARGIEIYNDEKEKEALELLTLSLDYPIDVRLQALAHFWRGEIYYRSDRYKDAIYSHNKFLGLEKMSENLPQEVSKALSAYTIGYSYFKQKKYDNALTYFKQAYENAKNDQNSFNNRIIPDATLRTADSYFMVRMYDNAIEYYEEAVRNQYTGSDYAMFQKGILLGLTDNLNEKIQTMQHVIENYPGSIYADDALFETANTYLALEKPERAISTFNALLSKYGSGQFAGRSLLKLGLIYYNLEEPQKALAYYKNAVSRFPESNISREAINSIKNIYIDLGDPEGYISYLDDIPSAKISISEQDSITYLAAETQFSKGDCEKAIESFDRYLEKFQDGAFKLSAHFYRGECLYNKEEYKKAIEDYAYVIDKAPNLFIEKSLHKASRIAFFISENYELAFNFYKMLLNEATFKENKKAALTGLMRSAYAMDSTRLTMKYGRALLEYKETTPADSTSAFYFMAKSAHLAGDTAKAMDLFRKTVKRTTSERAAESQYRIADILFEKGLTDSSRSALFVVVNELPSYEHWVVKSFLLLADIFIKKNNLFQAKATLQSIMDNYEGGDEEILSETREKMAKVLTLEKQQSKLKKDTTSTDTMKFMPADTLQQLETPADTSGTKKEDEE